MTTPGTPTPPGATPGTTPGSTHGGTPGAAPRLSVVLVTPERGQLLRRTIRHLRAQSIRDAIELILIAPDAACLDDLTADDLAGFASVQRLGAGPIDNVDKAAAAGIRHARSDVVALIEDHAYPQPGWAEAILRAHEGPWAAVGSAVVNANPHSPLSWTNQLMAYGKYTPPVAAGPTRWISRHNIVFKRNALQPFVDRLDDLLGRDGDLLGELHRAGHRFYLEPAAVVAHANPSRLASTLELRFFGGRLAAAKRAEGSRWSRPRRTLYAAAAPLLSLRRVWPLKQKLFHQEHRRRLPRLLPALALGVGLDAAGQALGYLTGPGNTARRLADFENGRFRHMTRRDRTLLLDPAEAG